MPAGIIINAGSVLFGGLLGGFLGNKLTEKFKKEITLIFGVCSMGMGIYLIGPMKYMPAVIFALVIGTAIGLAIHLGEYIDKGAMLMQRPISKLFPNENLGMTQDEFISSLVTIIVLFCASGKTIYYSRKYIKTNYIFRKRIRGRVIRAFSSKNCINTRWQINFAF